MKKLLLALVLFTTTQVHAQTKVIDSFLGIKFGSTPQQVALALKAKGAIKDVAGSKPSEWLYSNVRLGGRKAEILVVRFLDGKVYQATFAFKPKLEPQLIDLYKEISTDITAVYGEGEEKKEFKSPFEDGDGHELLAIEGGSADISTTWSDEKGLIFETISSDMVIGLTYGDIKLGHLATERDRAKERADF